jgi:hypothetical protein
MYRAGDCRVRIVELTGASPSTVAYHLTAAQAAVPRRPRNGSRTETTRVSAVFLRVLLFLLGLIIVLARLVLDVRRTLGPM